MTTGQSAWTGTGDNWLGGPAAMWWSHADATTYRSRLHQSGLEVTDQQFVPEGDGVTPCSGHAEATHDSGNTTSKLVTHPL